ncbi:MAG: transposase [Geminocystis sp.]|nr:transposase [Geminocystis sp.]HIK37227.1 transposase [Geminocystis sp. M7585_C2015_104]MCS7147142.1 transposase [Geminocystis sp.]MCX8079109.1 transposase [Geminocystis sp.]MDW8116778.1 transposase [Geminocystis sp.]
MEFWQGGDKTKKNTDKNRINALDYYTYRGNSHITFAEDATSDSICKTFEDVTEANRDKQVILAILDNFRSHKSYKVREKTEESGIELVFLPPKSPELNTIEQVWGVIKRVISVRFVRRVGKIEGVFWGLYEDAVVIYSFCRFFSEN